MAVTESEDDREFICRARQRFLIWYFQKEQEREELRQKKRLIRCSGSVPNVLEQRDLHTARIRISRAGTGRIV